MMSVPVSSVSPAPPQPGPVGRLGAGVRQQRSQSQLRAQASQREEAALPPLAHTGAASGVTHLS